MESKISIQYVVFAKEMKKLMEFQKYINIHLNFNKKTVLVEYFEELYNYISNFDNENNILEMIKTLITEKIIINTDFLEDEAKFEEDYIIVLEIFRLILEYDNLKEEIIEKKDSITAQSNIAKQHYSDDKKLIKKFNKITLD